SRQPFGARAMLAEYESPEFSLMPRAAGEEAEVDEEDVEDDEEDDDDEGDDDDLGDLDDDDGASDDDDDDRDDEAEGLDDDGDRPHRWAGSHFLDAGRQAAALSHLRGRRTGRRAAPAPGARFTVGDAQRRGVRRVGGRRGG